MRKEEGRQKKHQTSIKKKVFAESGGEKGKSEAFIKLYVLQHIIPVIHHPRRCLFRIKVRRHNSSLVEAVVGNANQRVFSLEPKLVEKFIRISLIIPSRPSLVILKHENSVQLEADTNLECDVTQTFPRLNANGKFPYIVTR